MAKSTFRVRGHILKNREFATANSSLLSKGVGYILKNLELSGKYKPFQSGDWEEPGVVHGNYHLLESGGCGRL